MSEWMKQRIAEMEEMAENSAPKNAKNYFHGEFQYGEWAYRSNSVRFNVFFDLELDTILAD